MKQYTLTIVGLLIITIECKGGKYFHEVELERATQM